MSIRTERVGRLVQREVADLLRTSGPVDSNRMWTVTGAKLTRDLSIAYIYVSCLAETADERAKAFAALEELTPRIRTELGSRIRHQVRRIPELRFLLDDSLSEAARIEELLDSARRERQQRGDD